MQLYIYFHFGTLDSLVVRSPITSKNPPCVKSMELKPLGLFQLGLFRKFDEKLMFKDPLRIQVKLPDMQRATYNSKTEKKDG